MEEEEVRQGMMGADVQTQATPDDKDNCDQNVSIGDAGRDDWPESPLSKVYSKAGTPVIDELRNRGMLVQV